MQIKRFYQPIAKTNLKKTTEYKNGKYVTNGKMFWHQLRIFITLKRTLDIKWTSINTHLNRNSENSKLFLMKGS